MAVRGGRNGVPKFSSAPALRLARVDLSAAGTLNLWKVRVPAEAGIRDPTVRARLTQTWSGMSSLPLLVAYVRHPDCPCYPVLVRALVFRLLPHSAFHRAPSYVQSFPWFTLPIPLNHLPTLSALILTYARRTPGCQKYLRFRPGNRISGPKTRPRTGLTGRKDHTGVALGASSVQW